MTISSKDIRYGYSFILGREPESAALIAHATFPDISCFREALLKSGEFRASYNALVAGSEEHPYLRWSHDAVAFLHLPKTGGLTLHTLLSACFPHDRICPERRDRLHYYSPIQLADYDFFSGHFGYFSLRFIPRHRVRCVSIFREPRDRLISWYRFLRLHRPGENFSDDPLVSLANNLSPEEFFENTRVVSSLAANNMYLFYFGFPWPHSSAIDALAHESVVSDALQRAKQRVHDLDAVGLTERFDESAEVIFRSLGLPAPQHVDPVNVTDELLASDVRITRVPPVAMTPRLSQALEPLTRFDREIYDLAKWEFECRRLAFLPTAQDADAAPM